MRNEKRKRGKNRYRRNSMHPAVRLLRAVGMVCLFLSLLLTPFSVCALGQGKEAIPRLDADRTGSITVEMLYDNKAVVGGTLKAYWAGRIVEYENEEGGIRYKFDWTDPFTDFEGEPEDVQSASLARGLAVYIQKMEESKEDGSKENGSREDKNKESGGNRLDGYYYTQENVDGRILFKDLSAGLYLILQSESSQGYESLSPFLVSIPMLEDGNYVYDVNAHSKFALKMITEPTPSPTPEVTPSPSPSPTPEVTPSPTPKVTPSPSPSPTPKASPSPSPTPKASPTPSPSPTPEASPSPSPTPETSPSPSPTSEASPSPNPTPEASHDPLSDEEPDPPSDEEGDNPPLSQEIEPKEKLPQTGQMNWPVPVFGVSGAAMALTGMALHMSGKKEKRGKGGAIGKIGALSAAAGVLLVTAGLCLLLWNQREARTAEDTSKTMLTEVKKVIEKHREILTAEPDNHPNVEEQSQSSDTAEEINDYEYMGYISIPSLLLELPVMTQWDYDRLKLAPCRYYGSDSENNLVIAGHNYPAHFGRLSELKKEDEIFFTDMDGDTYRYEVDAIDVLAPEALEEMTDAGYDLTLFTCTYGGANRVAVRCIRRDGE